MGLSRVLYCRRAALVSDQNLKNSSSVPTPKCESQRGRMFCIRRSITRAPLISLDCEKVWLSDSAESASLDSRSALVFSSAGRCVVPRMGMRTVTEFTVHTIDIQSEL
jgi:hypothetical protein